MKLRRTALALTFAALSTHAYAQAEDPVQCLGMIDRDQRLACFDRTVSAVQKTREVEKVKQAAQKQERFGLPVPVVTADDESLTSRVAGVFEGWYPGSRVSLSNGQVWEFVGSSTAAYELPNPVVQVKRGTLGSFFMYIEGVSAVPKVRRVK